MFAYDARGAAKTLIVSAFTFLAGIASADTIRIGGTGGALGTMVHLGEAFMKAYPEHSVKVVPSLGSGGGIKALQGGALDIAVSARDLTPEEKSTGLSSILYGVTAFIFISHDKAPAPPLTKSIIANIYSGKQDTWGDGQPIRVILRPQQDTDTRVLKKISPEIKAAVEAAHARQGMMVAITDTDAANQIEKVPNAFGTSTLSLVLSESRNVNILPVDGVYPSEQSLNDGSYAYTKNMYAVKAAAPSKAARQFIDFMHSSKGREIIKKNGHKISHSH